MCAGSSGPATCTISPGSSMRRHCRRRRRGVGSRLTVSCGHNARRGEVMGPPFVDHRPALTFVVVAQQIRQIQRRGLGGRMTLHHPYAAGLGDGPSGGVRIHAGVGATGASPRRRRVHRVRDRRPASLFPVVLELASRVPEQDQLAWFRVVEHDVGDLIPVGSLLGQLPIRLRHGDQEQAHDYGDAGSRERIDDEGGQEHAGRHTHQ